MVAIQQYRVFRLLMVLVIVALTIFLYASYYASPNLQMPGRMQPQQHTAAALFGEQPYDEQRLAIIQTNELSDGSPPQASSAAAAVHIQTVSEDVNGSFAQQYSDVSIPSSSSSFGIPQQQQTSASNNSSKQISSTATQKSGSRSNAVGTGAASAPVSSVIDSSSSSSSSTAAVAAAGQQQRANVTTASKDTLNGIRTGDLYEPGHSEANTDLCPDSGEFLRLLILITSAPTHLDARLAIRQTWGHYATRRDISIGFVLGSTDSQQTEDSLAAENYMYGDLIRGHFVDSYNNLTLKTISSLEWVDTYCPKVSFVLKTDDDMFINVQRLLVFIQKHHEDTNVIFGRLAKKWKPIRNKKSKYYVSPQQYFPPVFPQFTTGPAYLMSSDVVHGLYAKALNQTYLKLEDVFTTGIVAQLVNVKRVHVNEFLNRRIAFNPCNIRKAISVHMIKSNEQFDLWKKLLDSTTKCK